MAPRTEVMFLFGLGLFGEPIVLLYVPFETPAKRLAATFQAITVALMRKNA